MICRFYKLTVSHPNPSHPANESQSFWFSIKIFSRSTLAVGPQPPLSDPGKQVGIFVSTSEEAVQQYEMDTEYSWLRTDRNNTQHQLPVDGDCSNTPTPKYQHRNPSAISQNIWHFSRYFKRRIYSFTISRLYSMVCASLGFHGTLVGKHWCTLQESYTYAISVAVQQGVSDIRMHT